MKDREKIAIFMALIVGSGVFLGSVCFAQSTGAVGERHGGMMQAGGPQDQGNLQGKMKMAISDEAVSACDDASEKDDCSFEATIGSSSKTMSGTCMKNPQDTDKLACMPIPKDSKGGPQDQGNPQGKMAISDEAVSACDDASEKDDCSFEATIGSSSKMMSGTCMKNPKDESKLFCAPAVKNNTDADSVEEVEAMRDDRESEISKIENRVEKIISFLKSEDIDTDEIESDLETFKDKADALLSAIDAYIDALGDNSDDDAVKSDRESVGSAGKAMMDYFHETLRKSIEEALLKVN